MTHLIRIGNSRGIRIPKAVIGQADLEGKELELKVVEEGLLVTPVKAPRQDWEEAFNAMHEAGDDAPLMEDESNAFDKEEWTW